ncbi:MAG: tetratricopeptide repeat protein [Myxococcales bacterium]|nr:tetratricopeptide repeat protein [Myxococcales bacterium]
MMTADEPSRSQDFDVTIDALDDGRIATALVASERLLRGDKTLIPRLLRARALSKAWRFAESEAVLLAEPTDDLSAEQQWVLYRSWAVLRGEQRRHFDEVEWLRCATDLRPTETSGWIMMGCAYALAGRFTEAAACHQRATVCDGDPDEAFLNLGYVLRAEARFEEAREAFARALLLTPDYPEARSALADVSKALAASRRQSPTTRKATWKAAIEGWRSDRVASGLVAMDRYDALDPHSEPAKILRAEMLISIRRFSEAEASLLRVDDSGKARASCYAAWGSLRDAQGRFDEAISWYGRQLEVDPRSGADTAMGTSYAMSGRLDEAERRFRGAMRRPGDPSGAQRELGHILRMQLRLDEARDVLEACLHRKPRSERARRSLEDVAQASALLGNAR